MKKILNTILIASILSLSANFVLAKKVKSVDETMLAAKKEKEIQIVEPEKNVKVNHKKEIKKLKSNARSKAKSSHEAEGMYETKFPTIDSQISYTDMNGEVTLSDCIKLAITHHPAIMSAISNSEIYKSKIGQAWSNYFPTLSAGVNYSRNDMFMTMGNKNSSFMRMMEQKYNMYYVPNISANMLLFDFGKTKATADSAKRTYESSRYDAETSIENVIYNVKVAYYNMVFAKIQLLYNVSTVRYYVFFL